MPKKKSLEISKYVLKHIVLLPQLFLLTGDIFFVFSLLASGSDDQHAIIWDPFKHKKLTTMHTGHAANIFSVKVRRTECDIAG